MSAVARRVRFLFSADLERLFTQMVVASVVVHIMCAAAVVLAPKYLGGPARPAPAAIQVDLTYNLPKGPGMGPMAPDRDQAAIRQSDPRRMAEIMKERAEKIDADTVKLANRREVNTNKLGWKDRQRLEAIEKLREKHALMDTVGGGGTARGSSTGVLGIYIANLQSRILSVWSLPGGLPNEYLEKTVYVRIYVGQSGNVIRQEMSRPSGFEPLDRSCQSAIVKASPLPPPPTLLADELRNSGILIRFHPIEKQH
jgi:TonB family protein